MVSLPAGRWHLSHSTVMCLPFSGYLEVSCSFTPKSDGFHPSTLCHSAHSPFKGQFEARPKKGECAECHNVDGRKPSLFGVKEHDTSKYPLKANNITVDCDNDHQPP